MILPDRDRYQDTEIKGSKNKQMVLLYYAGAVQQFFPPVKLLYFAQCFPNSLDNQEQNNMNALFCYDVLRQQVIIGDSEAC